MKDQRNYFHIEGKQTGGLSLGIDMKLQYQWILKCLKKKKKSLMIWDLSSSGDNEEPPCHHRNLNKNTDH